MDNIRENNERRQALLDRIVKMLALAEDSTFPEESYTAVAMAQRLMAENGLTDADVEAMSAEERREAVGEAEVEALNNRWMVWQTDMAEVVSRNFRCRYFILTQRRPRRQTIKFLGLKDDLVIARDVYCAAVATARRQARDYTARVYYRSDAERAAAYDSYLEGYCNGLAEALDRQLREDATLALLCVVPTAVRERYDELIPPTAPRIEFHAREDRPFDYEAMDAGWEAGRQFRYEPTRQIGEGPAQLPAGED